MEKKKKQILIGAAAAGAAVLCLFLLNTGKGKNDSFEIKNGYITLEGTSSEVSSRMFYEKNGAFRINLTGLDLHTDLDVIKNKGSYIIANMSNQMKITPDVKEYDFNSVTFSEDATYLAPIVIDDYVYADSNMIFGLFGYDVEYQYNSGKTAVEAILTQKENFNKDDKKITVMEHATKEEPKIDVPSGWSKEDAEKEQMNTNEPVTVPDSPEIDKSILAEPETVPNETESAAEETEASAETEDEKKEERWEKVEEELTNLFQSSTPNFEREPYSPLGDDAFCFNAGKLGVLGNTISVVHNSGEGYHMVVYLSAEWSDQALNVATPESKAFYTGLEDVYKKTLIYALGETEGTDFFNYLKQHADQTTEGGYVNVLDEKGIAQPVWTDGPVGDGIGAKDLELSQWTGRYTDDGYAYEITRNGDGLKLVIF